MATSWQYEAPGRALLTIKAPCSTPECIAAIDEVTGDPRWGASGRLLIDRRKATAPSKADVEQVLGGMSERAALKGALVIVVVESDVAYGAVRMAQILADTQGLGFQLEVVRDFDEGLRMLGA